MSDVSLESATTSVDWSSISTTVECPLCLYNLRGLIEPRCPECGYQFEWPDLLDPDRRRHRYLFEHHPRRNCWSFLRTLVGGLRPHKFWYELNPRQTISVRRLWIYFLLCSCFLVLVPVAALLKVSVGVARVNAFAQTYGGGVYLVYPPQQFQQFQQSVAPPAPTAFSAAFFRQVWEAVDGRDIFFTVGLLVFTLLLWPWLTFAALMIFQASMRKAQTQRAHVLRCVIYSADASVWYLVLLMASLITLLLLPIFGSQDLSGWTPDEVAGYLLILLGLIFLYRMWMAYWSYLQFDHSFWTVLATQLIVLLAMTALTYWGPILVHRIMPET